MQIRSPDTRSRKNKQNCRTEQPGRGRRVQEERRRGTDTKEAEQGNGRSKADE